MTFRWTAVLVCLLAIPLWAGDCPTCGGDCEQLDPTEHLKQIQELMREAEDLLINGLEVDEVVDAQKEIIEGLKDQDQVIQTLDHLIQEIESKG